MPWPEQLLGKWYQKQRFLHSSLCLEKGTGGSLVWKLLKKKERNMVTSTGYRITKQMNGLWYMTQYTWTWEDKMVKWEKTRPDCKSE